MRKINFNSFKFKLTLSLVLAMLFSGTLSNLLVSKFALDAQFNQLREKLMIIAQTTAVNIDVDMLKQISLNPAGKTTPAYKIIAEKLKRIKQVNPPIRYIYTMAPTDQPGIWQFIVDPDIPTESERRKGLSSNPGDKYDASRFPEMLKAQGGASADKQLTIDEWGVTLSGYAPIRDNNGKLAAVLGVDMQAKDVYKIQQGLRWRAILVLWLGVILSVIIGLLISKRISSPLKKLVEGTRHIAAGNLQYQVEIKGDNEISELAKSFNDMALCLFEARKKLHNYFYNVMQALVRILEAKDSYIRGHSERVAEYTEQIARRMGFPEDKLELLKESAVLHDIGKLGIEETILNKKGKLTEEEWEIIRKHPVIGEGILKPVLLTDEMAEVIRSHHERYDGKGYPDKLSGEQLHLLVKIVSVADAYDAMTSVRAYRAPLTKAEAASELIKNKGSQFDAQVVDVFVKILGET